MQDKVEIEIVLKHYLMAFYTKEYDAMYDLIYEDDAIEYKATFMEMAYKIDAFGENEDLLTQLGVDGLSDLDKMSTKVFLITLFKVITREIGSKALNKILKGLTITAIDDAEYVSIVSYKYPVKVFDEWEDYDGQVEMIRSNGQWKILFKTKVGPFDSFLTEIESYNRRKKFDQLENFRFEGDLTPFSIVGYKDFGTDKVVIEPRFREAEEFSNGLACVKIFSKYGYINLKGKLAIKPKYLYANKFSQNVAAVAIKDQADVLKWGFINRRGKYIIEPKYDAVGEFSQSLCRVRVNKMWGYINKKDEIVIPFKFVDADDFEHGSAFVDVHNSKKEVRSLRINKKGEIID